MDTTPQFQSCSNHHTRDEAVSCYHFATGAHGANHFSTETKQNRTEAIMLAESQKSSTAITKLESGAGCGEKRPTNTNGDTQLPMKNHEGADETASQSASDFSILHRPHIIRSAEERRARYAPALTCEGGGLDRFIARVDAILDREMAEPSDFDHDSFAASEFAAGIGGAK